MKAIDTVMSLELQKIYECNQIAGLEWQAEISFKAGIKEVVDWIWFNPQLTKHQNWQNYPEWQAKLKEWGIE